MSDTVAANEVRASYPQERIWFVHQLAPGSGAYNIVLNHSLPEPADLEALKWAFAKLIERHEVLRTTFAQHRGVVFQIIHQMVACDIPLIDISDLDETDSTAAVERLMDQELRTPFDLQSGPLIHCKAVQSSPERLTALIVMHHIISDGWSTNVLAGDLNRLYANYFEGDRPTLPPLPIQYADYSEWQRARSNSRKFQTQLAYWLKQLKDAPPLIELPLDRPRTASPDMTGKVKFFTVSSDVSRDIAALVRHKQATTFMVLVAAFKAMLFRMTGQSDIVIATVVANRTRVELEQMVGCFLNNLVLRDKLDAQATFEETIEQVRDTTLDAYSNQDVPFELVVEQLNPPRSLSHNAVFQVMVAFQNFVTDQLVGLRLGTDSAEDAGSVMTTPAIAKFDLSLSMWEVGGTLGGAFEYRSDLFDDDTIDRLIGHYHVLLADAAARPQTKLRNLKVLSDREYDKIVKTWNGWELDYPADRTIHAMIEEQVARTPDATAVIFGDTALTYRQLNDRANLVAHQLVERGCKPERIVGIMLEQSLDMIVSILAVLKAGGAYLAIDTRIPSERLAYTIKDAQPLAVLTHAEHVEKLAAAGATPLLVDNAADAEAAAGSANPDLPQSSRTLAYVLYTSGSTGWPKGVMIEHRSVLHHLWGMNLQYQFGTSDCFFQCHAYTFDVSVWEFFLPLVTGGRVAMVQPDGHQDPSQIVKAMASAGVTYACLLPPMLQLVLADPGVGELNKSLRWVICGGEPLAPELVSRGFATLTANIDNAYGPTEATVHNTYYHCQPGSQPAVIPIGRAMPGAKVYILDPYLNPVPVGASGEICIGGDAVGRGYLNNPELTAEKFIQDPFADVMDARLYKTGDIGRFLPDGNIEFQGRRDMQIKLRGFRIELGEITHTLKQHSAVKDCVTIVREDRPGDRRIVSYVVAENSSELMGSLLEYLSARLPEHMIPSAFVWMERLPLKDSNKVDIPALPPPSEASLRSGIFVPPSTADECRLAEIWKDLLGVAQAGVRDNFFELGGHSLLVTRLIARIRAEMGAVLSIRDVFRSPILGELAIVIQEARRTFDDEPDDEIIVRTRTAGGQA
jgi:amino acid adenylation domain-containing protein